jgi:hypothetical protein
MRLITLPLATSRAANRLDVPWADDVVVGLPRSIVSGRSISERPSVRLLRPVA